MMLHDWVDFPPFTDLEALKQHHSVKDRLVVACINSLLVLIPYHVLIVLMLLCIAASYNQHVHMIRDGYCCLLRSVSAITMPI